MIWSRKRNFDVTVHLNGRHPYLSGAEHDFETRDVVVRVKARSWNDAERRAYGCIYGDWWSARVTQISAVRSTPEKQG